MSDRILRLGDKVVLSGGPHAGREGYVVLITDADDVQQIRVRLATKPSEELIVKPSEIRKL